MGDSLRDLTLLRGDSVRVQLHCGAPRCHRTAWLGNPHFGAQRAVSGVPLPAQGMTEHAMTRSHETQHESSRCQSTCSDRPLGAREGATVHGEGLKSTSVLLGLIVVSSTYLDVSKSDFRRGSAQAAHILSKQRFSPAQLCAPSSQRPPGREHRARGANLDPNQRHLTASAFREPASLHTGRASGSCHRRCTAGRAHRPDLETGRLFRERAEEALLLSPVRAS